MDFFLSATETIEADVQGGQGSQPQVLWGLRPSMLALLWAGPLWPREAEEKSTVIGILLAGPRGATFISEKEQLARWTGSKTCWRAERKGKGDMPTWVRGKGNRQRFPDGSAKHGQGWFLNVKAGRGAKLTRFTQQGHWHHSSKIQEFTVAPTNGVLKDLLFKIGAVGGFYTTWYTSKFRSRDVHGGPVVRAQRSQCGGRGGGGVPGSIPSQGAGSHMPQLRPSTEK